MQHAKHLHILPGSSIEDEIVFKSGDRHDANTLEILVPNIPDTTKSRQRHKLRTGVFQCRHETRSRLKVIDPDIFGDLECILPGLGGKKRRGEHAGYAERCARIREAASVLSCFQASLVMVIPLPDRRPLRSSASSRSCSRRFTSSRMSPRI